MPDGRRQDRHDAIKDEILRRLGAGSVPTQLAFNAADRFVTANALTSGLVMTLGAFLSSAMHGTTAKPAEVRPTGFGPNREQELG